MSPQLTLSDQNTKVRLHQSQLTLTIS